MGRNGGWGSLLGDEGSGWSLGREAIKSVLSYAANKRDLLPWHLSILDRFELDNPDRLITAVSQLDTNLSHGLADSGRKKRIASCAKVAVKAAEKGDVEATRIVVKVAEEIIGTIRPLVDRPGVTLLVVTGGLAGAEVFWKEVERGMKHMGWNWAEVIKVDDPAMEGLQSIQDAFT
jgi:N-acetylglucosamine kinase-like BadF-type ATPase